MHLLASNVCVGYGRLPIVSDVDLDCSSGQISALIGPNGAGKSTLLKGIGGVVSLISGSIVVDGVDISKMQVEARVRRGLAFVPQSENVFPTLNVMENLEMGGFLLGRSHRKVHDRIEEVLGIFPDLNDARKKRAVQLSGGQRNMLAVARALMLEPSVLMLDEPTAGLAPQYVSRVWNRIEAIANTGVSILIVEQNVDEALSHAHNVYVLVAGKVALCGSPSELESYNLSALFLGSSPEEAHIQQA